MAKFASAGKQSASVMKEMQGHIIPSVGTVRNYEQALTSVAQYVKESRDIGDLRQLTPNQAHIYLEQRSEMVGQKTLDMERQAIQAMMLNVTGKLNPNEHLNVIKSDHQQILKSRAYSIEQVNAVANHQTEKHALATAIAHASGLRAHELHSIRTITERSPNERPANDYKFSGREGERYTVHGKGGLVREVCIPKDLADRLETRRLENPVQVTDRNVNYIQTYDIGAGQRWSNSFSSASNRANGWSEGAHGVRHSYAQERMNELQTQGLARELALETVSQEMGHFRPEITETYLR